VIFGYLPSLGFNDDWQQQVILWTFNVSALLAMFFSNQFADRTFSAEKFLSFSHLVGGAAMLGLFFIRKEGDNPAPFWPFFGLMMLHTLFYVPTISITNSIAFANLKDPQKEFGPIRLWGTIGWIAAATPLIFILVDWSKVPAFGSVGTVEWLGKALGTSKTGVEYRQATSYAFIVSGVASLLLAAFSLLLPRTPPKPATESRDALAWVEAIRLLRLPFVLVLFIVTFIDAGVHQLYFFWTERFLTGGVGIAPNWAPQVMTIGQVAEILTMAILGFVLKSLGWRWTMVIGILGHAVRFSVFAFFPQPVPAVTVILLHGICYAFFFATVYIFVDEFFPKDIRASAQGLFNFLILGAGPFVGNFVGAKLGAWCTVPTVDQKGITVPMIDFKQLFLVPAITAVIAALILLLFFHPPAKKEEAAA
jgi:hypothetical protein